MSCIDLRGRNIEMLPEICRLDSGDRVALLVTSNWEIGVKQKELFKTLQPQKTY